MVDPLYTEGQILPLRAGESETITAGKLLELKSDGDVGVATSASVTVIGVALTDVTTTASDERYPIAVIAQGVVTVTASTNISIGALVASSNNGKSITHTPGAATYDEVVGVALTAGSANATHRVLLKI